MTSSFMGSNWEHEVFLREKGEHEDNHHREKKTTWAQPWVWGFYNVVLKKRVANNPENPETDILL